MHTHCARAPPPSNAICVSIRPVVPVQQANRGSVLQQQDEIFGKLQMHCSEFIKSRFSRKALLFPANEILLCTSTQQANRVPVSPASSLLLHLHLRPGDRHPERRVNGRGSPCWPYVSIRQHTSAYVSIPGDRHPERRVNERGSPRWP